MNALRRRIYLAGKIAKGDWRHSIVNGLRNAFCGGCYDPPEDSLNWPVLENAAFGFDYAGPYFIADDHGCFHGNGTHGVGAGQGYYHHQDPYTRMDEVVKCCLRAIERTDILFAWVDDETCYGTLAEIGYAKALNKTIWIASPRYPSDLWFAWHLADIHLYDAWLSPRIALQMCIAKDEYQQRIRLAIEQTRKISEHKTLPGAVRENSKRQ